MTKIHRLVICVCVLLALTAAAHAWLGQGHAITARASVAVLPVDVPAFFRDAAASNAIVESDVECDLMRDTGGPQVRSTEACNHFIDLEEIWPEQLPATAKDLPKDRFDFIRLCNDRKVKPEHAGFVFYATIESLQKLDVAFAQHRRWPNDPAIMARCLIYAGQLAHYSQDLCQPLHTTIHYDGRANADGSSSHTGIHTRTDDVPGRINLTIEQLTKDQTVENFADPAQAIFDALMLSHAKVDRVYEIEKELPGKGGANWTPTPAVTEFGLERTRAATKLTASLWYTAWKRSETTAKRMPAWRERMNATAGNAATTAPASAENP